MNSIFRRALHAAIIGLFVFELAGCGGSGGTVSPQSASQVPAIAVTVSGNAQTTIGISSQYTATVSGSSNTAVTWAVNGNPGGNSALGTISSSGLYTPPGTVPQPNSVTIQAVSQADPSAIGGLSVTVVMPAASATAAARLLDQAAFGATAAMIAQVQQSGLGTFIDQQLQTPATAMPPVPPASSYPAYCNTTASCNDLAWWNIALTGNDQLRQRVALALSEIFVVSYISVDPRGFPYFLNVLANDAFSNWLTLMKDVTLSPAMGIYLNMVSSGKAQPGKIANENFAREMMQLFSLGLYKLNSDGSPQLDASGNPISTYTQAQVQAFAKAYTGWTFAMANGSAPTSLNTPAFYDAPMMAVESAHDTSAKSLLNGVTLPAGQSAEQDLDDALQNIFQDPALPPFISKQLIQHLVTSNPSPQYVARVTAVFSDDGNGTRGDMPSVVKAILLDPEARAGDITSTPGGGHLREPIVWITGVLRGLGATPAEADIGAYNALSSAAGGLSQQPHRSPSVFNFFPPGYTIPGTHTLGPEFDLENTATAIQLLSTANSIVQNSFGKLTIDLSATSPLGRLAALSPSQLVDQLNLVFMDSAMSAGMRNAILAAITPITSAAQRARVAVYLVITSSQYKIAH